MEPKLLVKCSHSEQSTLGKKKSLFYTNMCKDSACSQQGKERSKNPDSGVQVVDSSLLPGEKAGRPGPNRETHKGLAHT